MNLVNQIYLRKSCRKYVDDAIDMEPIHDFISHLKPLNEKIDYRYEILKKDDLSIRARWRGHIIWHYIPRKKKIILKT